MVVVDIFRFEGIDGVLMDGPAIERHAHLELPRIPINCRPEDPNIFEASKDTAPIAGPIPLMTRTRQGKDKTGKTARG
jgi:hypothetical protein